MASQDQVAGARAVAHWFISFVAAAVVFFSGPTARAQTAEVGDFTVRVDLGDIDLTDAESLDIMIFQWNQGSGEYYVVGRITLNDLQRSRFRRDRGSTVGREMKVRHTLRVVQALYATGLLAMPGQDPMVIPITRAFDMERLEAEEHELTVIPIPASDLLLRDNHNWPNDPRAWRAVDFNWYMACIEILMAQTNYVSDEMFEFLVALATEQNRLSETELERVLSQLHALTDRAPVPERVLRDYVDLLVMFISEPAMASRRIRIDLSVEVARPARHAVRGNGSASYPTLAEYAASELTYLLNKQAVARDTLLVGLIEPARRANEFGAQSLGQLLTALRDSFGDGTGLKQSTVEMYLRLLGEMMTDQQISYRLIRVNLRGQDGNIVYAQDASVGLFAEREMIHVIKSDQGDIIGLMADTLSLISENETLTTRSSLSDSCLNVSTVIFETLRYKVDEVATLIVEDQSPVLESIVTSMLTCADAYFDVHSPALQLEGDEDTLCALRQSGSQNALFSKFAHFAREIQAERDLDLSERVDRVLTIAAQDDFSRECANRI